MQNAHGWKSAWALLALVLCLSVAGWSQDQASIVGIITDSSGAVIPGAKVSVVGVARNEETLQAHTYLERLVGEIDQRLAWIVDPMLATGGSMVATIDMLKKAGCREIRALVLVAAPVGIEAVLAKHPDVEIYTASIDDGLNEHGYIMPGLGDAGDRIFGTKQKTE